MQWSWQPQTGINGLSFKVEQVQDTSSTAATGFTSGDQTASGSFAHQFNQPGTFYYWSGYVESSAQIFFRGVIIVKDTIDKELEVNVYLNGFQGISTKIILLLKHF